MDHDWHAYTVDGAGDFYICKRCHVLYCTSDIEAGPPKVSISKASETGKFIMDDDNNLGEGLHILMTCDEEMVREIMDE